MHSVERDCKVLESFGIMDYSLLLGIHNIDQNIREKAEVSNSQSDIVELNGATQPFVSGVDMFENSPIAKPPPDLFTQK